MIVKRLIDLECVYCSIVILSCILSIFRGEIDLSKVSGCSVGVFFYFGVYCLRDLENGNFY